MDCIKERTVLGVSKGILTTFIFNMLQENMHLFTIILNKPIMMLVGTFG